MTKQINKQWEKRLKKQLKLCGNHYLWLDEKPRYIKPILFIIALLVCLYLLVRLCQSGGWEQFDCK